MEAASSAGRVFFGRSEECALFRKRLEAFGSGYRQNIGVVGAPWIGKTSLLRVFGEEARKQPDLLVVTFSCKEFESIQHFADRWIGEVLVSSYRYLVQQIPPSFHELIGLLKAKLPRTIRRIKETKKLILKHRYDQAYRHLLGLTGVVQEEIGRKVVFLIDEFHRLGGIGLNDPFGQLGQEIMVQKETMFVVASSLARKSMEIFRSKLSMLFGNFEVVTLEPFSFEEAFQYCKSYASANALSQEERRFLIRLTNGNPFYLGSLLETLEMLLEKDSGREVHGKLMDAIENELFDEAGAIRRSLMGRLCVLGNGQPWQFYADVLACLAVGHKRFSEMVKVLHRKGNDIKRALERLVAEEIVEKQGSLFVIPDPVLRFWLNRVYYPLRFGFEMEVDVRRLRFEKEVEKAFLTSVQEDQKELPKRIEELLRQFQNDVVEFSGRKFKCPHFSEIVSKPNNGRVFPVVAKNGKDRWMCQVLSGRVTEEDVHLFKTDVKNLKAPVKKRVIFGLNGIDLNAKLLAQEAKIQYLDLKNLNFLLDLYDKPRLVVETQAIS